MAETKGNEISPYTLLNRWLYDGSNKTEMDESLREDKSIGPQYLLYYFKDSVYNLTINRIFNNYNIYKLDRLEILKFLKQCVLKTGYKPTFLPRYNDNESKISKLLKQRFPYYKKDDINLLVDYIDKSDQKDSIYETLGLYNPRKIKTKKKDKDRIKEFMELEKVVEVKKTTSLDKFMSGFIIV
jgi:hypothetical protein